MGRDIVLFVGLLQDIVALESETDQAFGVAPALIRPCETRC